MRGYIPSEPEFCSELGPRCSVVKDSGREDLEQGCSQKFSLFVLLRRSVRTCDNSSLQDGALLLMLATVTEDDSVGTLPIGSVPEIRCCTDAYNEGNIFMLSQNGNAGTSGG